LRKQVLARRTCEKQLKNADAFFDADAVAGTKSAMGQVWSPPGLPRRIEAC